jgi:sarcosine oxidase, subunit gamma
MADVASRALPRVPATEWLRAVPPAMRFILHADVRARAAAGSVWGVGFSEEPCRAQVADGRATLWLGPDEYLLLGADEDAQESAAEALERALGDIPHALVNIGHRQFALEVSGPHAATILSGGCPLDLDLAEFPVGMCTRTVFTKADIVLWRTAENSFHVEVWRSFSAYVTGLLGEIALEFYGRAG